MPPKKQQKKQIVPIFQQSIYWKYNKHSLQVQQKADLFLKTFEAQLKLLIDLQKSLYQNYQILCNKMGLDIHPCLSNKQRQSSQYPNLKSKDYGQKYVVFSSHKVDVLTLKLLGFLTSIYKLNTIKFSNNSLQYQIIQLKKFLEKQDQLTSLYFQWNNLNEVEGRTQLFLACYQNSLQHLILRQCQLGNQITIKLLNKISLNQTNTLASLDLYGNKLTNQVASNIFKFVQQSKKIQFLGISKNQLNSHEFLKNLFNSIGQIPVNQEQYQIYKQKQKQRDQINQRNKKRKKGTPQQPVPFLLQIKETQNGRFYIKNLTLRILNLSSNGIKDSLNKQSNIYLIKNFTQNQGKNVQIFLQGNSFSKKSKQMFKFYQNIYY